MSRSIRKENIEIAEKFLESVRVKGHGWCYFDAESGEWFICKIGDINKLGELLHGYEDEEHAYQIWIEHTSHEPLSQDEIEYYNLE